VTGLHGRAERCARGVTVYLVPGLTAWQRRAVIRRLRQEASRGFGAPLPAPQLAVALGVDRVRTAAGIARAIVRLHPAVALVPSACVAAMMTLFLVASAGGPAITPAPGSRGGLAEAAVLGGGAQEVSAGAAFARVLRARMTRVIATEGAGGAAVGGTVLGSGQQRTLVKDAHGKRQVRTSSRSGAWYLRPEAEPCTAHRPGPRDLAW
jgi:hypothetical protein